MGNGNIDVGNKTPTRKPGQPLVENSVGSDGSSELRIDNPSNMEPARICGAMSQQYGGSGRGNESVPQKFVQLVGCRDPKAKAAKIKDAKIRAEAWARPAAVKR